MANRTIRTLKKRALILASLEKNGKMVAACQAANVSRSAVHDWRRDDPDFAADVQRVIDLADEANTEDVEDSLLEQAKSGNVTAQIVWLKAHKRDKYGDRAVHEHTGPDGAPLTIQLASRPDGPA